MPNLTNPIYSTIYHRRYKMSDPKVVVMDRKEAAEYLGVGSFHVGELIRKGKFPNAEKLPITGRKTVKWFIPKDELDAYKSTRQSGVGKRADGRTKYTIYLTPAEMDAITPAVDSVGCPPITRANPGKSK